MQPTSTYRQVTAPIRTVIGLVVAGLAIVVLSLAAGTAAAAPGLEVDSTRPYMPPAGGTVDYELSVRNSGDVNTSGLVTLTATLPTELTATSVSASESWWEWVCNISGGGHTVTCTGPTSFGSPLPIAAGSSNCDGGFSGVIACPVLISISSPGGLSKGDVLEVDLEACGGGTAACATRTDSISVRNFGDAFEPARINDGPGPLQDSPAFPDTDDPATAGNDPDDLFWAGACDLRSAPAPGSALDMSAQGGVGTMPAQILIPNGSTPNPVRIPWAAPITPRHCIDWGAPQFSPDSWFQTPTWRLPAEVRAGAHPDGTATMSMERPLDGTIDNVIVDLPPGFVGDPQAVPQCPSAVFQRIPSLCPPETQVGVINLHLKASPFGGNLNTVSDDKVSPVYNVEPRIGRVAELGFPYASGDAATTVLLTAKPRTGSDNGVSAFAGQIPAALPLLSQSITLWGVPWATQNDLWRAPKGVVPATPCTKIPGQYSGYIPFTGFVPECQASYDRSWGPVKPFLTNETDCNGSPVTVQRIDSFQNPGGFSAWGEPDHSDPDWKTSVSSSPAVVDCGSLGFAPDVEIASTARSADGASGLGFDLSVPQNNDPKTGSGAALAVPGPGASGSEVDGYVDAASDYWRSDEGRATAHVKDSVVTLPAGVSVNPSGATGLRACSDVVVGVRQMGSPPLFNTNDPTDGLGGDDCPDGSKIGTVRVETPVLEQPLTGDVVLGEPRSTDPRSGEMFRMFLVVRDKDRGLLLKVYGTAVADPGTGQLTATFRNNPELPFDRLDVDIKGGERGLLALPQRCGAPGWSTALRPWSSVGAATPVADATDGGSFAIDQRCSNGFAPGLAAGMDTQAARSSGTFSFRFARSEGDQYLRNLTATLPKGLLASVRDLPLCSNAAADAGACPASSKIGIVDAKAGSGDPFVLEEKGEVFLTEGYKGGAYGLAVKVRPVAGAFRSAMELSPIVVRQAIHVDRKTAQVTAVSDPLPLIHHGVPLRVREVTVLVNRVGFMLNPSDCDAKQVGADLASDQGTSAGLSNAFQAAGCANLAFKPKLTLALTGRKQVRTGKHPGIKATVTQQGIPEAGIEKAEVRLPKSLALDVDNAQALCEFEAGTKADLENHCPKGSIVGRARAVSPLLNDPLAGNVYFVKNVRRSSSGNLIRTLPMIVVALRGEIAVNLVGESNVKSGKLVNTFDQVPDAPITQFNLNINGGRNGIIAVTRTRRSLINLCASKRQIAEADMDGHNGRRFDRDVRIKTSCTKRQTKAAKRTTKAAKRRAQARRLR